MRWRVEISHIYGNHRLLHDVLHDFSIETLEEKDEHFLVSDKFEALETAGEVYGLASRTQALIEQATKDDPLIRLSFKTGSVIEEIQEGCRRRHHFLIVGGIISRISRDGVPLEVKASEGMPENERRRLEEEKQEREYQRLKRKALSRVISADRYEGVVQVQGLFQANLIRTLWGK